MLDTITATDPVILNCLIDMRGIESILIIKVSALIPSQDVSFGETLADHCGASQLSTTASRGLTSPFAADLKTCCFLLPALQLTSYMSELD